VCKVITYKEHSLGWLVTSTRFRARDCTVPSSNLVDDNYNPIFYESEGLLSPSNQSMESIRKVIIDGKVYKTKNDKVNNQSNHTAPLGVINMYSRA
jgi:hypothetical protein